MDSDIARSQEAMAGRARGGTRRSWERREQGALGRRGGVKAFAGGSSW